MNLWSQNKGQNECAAAFVEAIETGIPCIPIDELFEVARVTIEANDILARTKITLEMQSIVTKFRTIRCLGLISVYIVLMHRLKVRFGLYSACKLMNYTLKGPFFKKSNLKISSLPAVSDWD